VKVRSAMLVSLSVIVHLGLGIVGGVFSGRYFNLTFDPRMSTACTVYTLMVNQVQNNSTLAVGICTGCGPDNQNSTSTVGAGLESFKKLLPTQMTSSQK
jgi:hypothetical protein